ncbi:hypothetical protein DFH07DRAFT_1062821 [Mycena maculata]|uniref:Uncharacterized protein n=1 Tax=Mycena maculata TaxID=230809 RepID=A0AAD7IPI3_9AGAR|nr:hypothetical protein DFH07DRAFT_1062821 [Mycena maculata]
MDDPWANAWGEPTTATKLPSAPAFPPQEGEHEEDITIPSWEAPVTWTDDNSLWGSRSPAIDKFLSWHSPYDDLPLGKPSSSPPTVPEDAEVASEGDEEEQEQVEPEPEPEVEPEPQVAFQPPTEPPFEPPISSSIIFPPLSPPGSPDAFGTFESGLDDLPPTSDPWTPAHVSFAPDSADSAWGPAWTPADEPERDEELPPVVDEWEAAKQQKVMQDRHVPPELLASILLQFTELANDLDPPLPTPTPDPDDYRASRHKGMDGFDSLNPTVVRLLPIDLTLPPPRLFLKSAIAKQTADALRLSRSAAFVRLSPLSHYSATKGSTAWEASVKRRPEAVGEVDLLPPGWRVVETKKDDSAVVDKKKTGHGGLLSFFGRRAGTPPVVEGSSSRRSSSPASGSSPRASMDSTKSPTLSAKSPTTVSPTTSVVASSIFSPTTSISTLPPPPPPPIVPVASQSQSDASAETDTTAPAAAPSAVSRFLGRFGRKTSAATGPQSLALSEGDFDFLSDIEGSVAGPSFGSADADFQITGALLDAPVPLPAKLAPPPRPAVPAVAAKKTGDKGRPEIDPNADTDELAIFGTYIPPPPVKPSAPPLAPSISTPVPKNMSPVDSDIDFSAWGFDDEKSGGVVRRDPEPVAGLGATRPPANPALNTRAANTRGAAPPPRRAPTAIMSSGPSKPPAVVPKLDGSFNFPPPPRTQTQTPIAAFPPPPGTKVTPAKGLLDDDDEFSDFHTPAQITPSQPSANLLYDASFPSSTSSDRGLFSSTSSQSIPTNLFDDFDDFMQASPVEPATLRTPSPPRPPSKPARITPPAPLSFAQPPTDDDTPLAIIASNASNLSLRSQRTAASHQRARSLVESAAATSGIRWPAQAPPSPLPEALAPPPNAADPFGFGGSAMQSQQAAFLGGALPALKASPPPPGPAAPIRALSPPIQSPAPPRFPPPPGTAAPMSMLSPPVLPPPGGLQKTQAPILPPPMLTAQRTPALPTPPPLSSAAPGKSSGGLSAQDLSFFEGL